MPRPTNEAGFKAQPLSSSSVTASTAYRRFHAQNIAFLLLHGRPVHPASHQGRVDL